MGDFLKCHRAYYLKNIYKNPKTGKKIGTISPALSLGSAVHEVLEGLIKYKTEERSAVPILEQFDKTWQRFVGKRGGFTDKAEEDAIKERGVEMIQRVKDNMEPLLQKTVKLPESKNGMPPNYFLSEEENIILCGKIDWLIWNPEDDSLNILDFKTGKNEEDEGSLQLPIYQLLLKAIQKRKVTGASYWYLDKEDKPREMALPSVEESYDKVMKIAKQVKEIRKKEEFLCPNGERGCFACRPLEAILRGEAEYVGTTDWQDLYMISH